MKNPPPAQLVRASKSYGSVTALHELDLTIAPGELLALLGANGAGKTTAVQLLLGLSSPTSGVARVFGRNPREAASRARTGAMLQVARVPETLKVREHIEVFRSYYAAPMPVAQIVAAAALHGVEERKFGELSGGQKQRVLFALAICGDPDLLVLDEPTVGLDVEARRSMWEQIRRFVQRGKSVLLTTHYLAEADALADRIVVVDRGRVVAEGTPAEVKSRSSGKKIRCSTSLPMTAVLAMTGVTAATRDGRTTEITSHDSDRTVRALLAADSALSDLEITAAGLEEAFLMLTNHTEELAS